MERAELKVIRYDEDDVIATSYRLLSIKGVYSGKKNTEGERVADSTYYYIEEDGSKKAETLVDGSKITGISGEQSTITYSGGYIIIGGETIDTMDELYDTVDNYSGWYWRENNIFTYVGSSRPQ